MATHLHKISQVLTETARTGNGRVVLSVPPRHGKSELTSKYFPAWYLGAFPDRRVILASYEAQFAATWGRKARRLVEESGHLFGVKVAADSSAADRWEIAGRDGGMMTAGVGGPVTGKGADILIVDDPIKNYEEACSETYRERTWDWFTSTAYTRLEPNGSCIVIQTRWHEDDLAGRILRELTHENWREIRFPALAEDGDPLGRKPGEALWPDRYNTDRLDDIRRTLGSYQWSALYQQRPTPAEGEFFKRPWFQIVETAPNPADFIAVVRAWDKAGTAKTGDNSAGVLIGVTAQDRYYVLDVVCGKWDPFQRNTVIRQTAELDALRYGQKLQIWLEQEPGSGGKESAMISCRELAGYAVQAEPVTGAKDARARPFAAQLEANNVYLVRAHWNRDYIDEHCAFPNGVHDDMVDGSSGAFNKVVLSRKKTLQWW